VIPTSEQIQASVIIATHNRANFIHETLGDLAAQKTAGFRFEILICDNASTDATKDIAAQFAKEAPVPVTYLYIAEKGKSYALNEGIARARGEYLFFTDDDTRLSSDWLSILYQAFVSTGADGIGGPIHPLWIGERPSWLSNKLLNQLGMVDHGPAPFFLKDKTKTFIGPNCAYKKSLYLRFGGYALDDTHEDVEWFLRAFRNKARLYYEPGACVRHKVEVSRLSLEYFEKRMYKHGRDIARGAWEKKEPALFGVPLWTIRIWFEIHVQALFSHVRGDRDTALWHWVRRNLYAGAIVHGFDLWRKKSPRRRVPPKIPTADAATVHP